MTAVGLCGSDRHWFVEGGSATPSLERAARPRTRVRRRDRVRPARRRARGRRPGDPVRPLRPSASRDSRTSASQLRFAGHGSTDGALRTLLAWPEQLVHPLPDSLPTPRRRCSSRSASRCTRSTSGTSEPGRPPASSAAGRSGCCSSRRSGPPARHVVATDPLPHRAATRRDAARRDARGPPADGSTSRSRSPATTRRSPTRSPPLRPGGRVVLVGIPDGDRTSFTASAARRKELTLAALPADDARRPAAGDPARRDRRIELAPLVTGAVPARRMAGRRSRPRRAARPEGRSSSRDREPLRARDRLRHRVGPRRARRLRRRARARDAPSTATGTA